MLWSDSAQSHSEHRPLSNPHKRIPQKGLSGWKVRTLEGQSISSSPVGLLKLFTNRILQAYIIYENSPVSVGNSSAKQLRIWHILLGVVSYPNKLVWKTHSQLIVFIRYMPRLGWSITMLSYSPAMRPLATPGHLNLLHFSLPSLPLSPLTPSFLYPAQS